jgi:hypothetical protein
VEINGVEMEVQDKSLLFIPGLSYHSCGIMLPDLWGCEEAPLPKKEGNYHFPIITGNWDRYTGTGNWRIFLWYNNCAQMKKIYIEKKNPTSMHAAYKILVST